MRVLLVGPDLESNLSLRYLASALRQAGHEPRIATFDCAGDASGVLAAAVDCDLIGLSMCFQVRAPEFLALARALKEAAPTRPIVAGGHFASCAAQELLERHRELDLIVVHEGEQALVELANLGGRLGEDAPGLRGLAVRAGPGNAPRLTPARPILEDLDLLPPPDRAGPARLVAGVPTAYLMGSRGCVNACDYCCITTLHRLAPGRRFRQRAPERVAGEMADLFHHRGVRQFVFHDDNFLVPSYAHNQARVARLEAALEERGVADIGLVLKCSPRDAERRILTRLKRLGLLRIFLGIESGTQCGLDAIGRKQTVAEAERALTLCEELELSSQYTLIIFHPEASPQSMLADLAFARRHPAHPLNYCRAEVYAGTPLEKRLLEAGRAIGDYLGRTYRYTDPRVERVWELGKDLFAGRCWGKDELLGQAIRLDHQVSVVQHFYEGKAAARLGRAWRELQVDLNLDTLELFSELVELCADASLDEPRAARARAGLERRELRSREVLLRRLCGLRADLEVCTRGALPVEVRPPSPRRPARSRSGVPRHAAAVAVALGLAGYGPAAQGQDAGKRPAVTDKRRGKVDAGVALEPAAPPVKPPYREDHGVAEAAPPPYDRYREDHGVAEAAPPPYDRLKPPPDLAPTAPRGFSDLTVLADPGLTVLVSDVGKASGRVALKGADGPLTFTVNGSTLERLFQVTLTRKPEGSRVALSIRADPKVKVTVDGREVGQTPLVTPARAPGRVVIELVEPESAQKLKLVLTVGS